MKATTRTLASLTALFFAGCQYETEEIEAGHRGAARRNPFLAAERFFDAKDYYTETSHAQPEVFENTAMIAAVQSFTTYGSAKQAIQWVQRGGHLVLLLRGGEAYRNDWFPLGEMGRTLDTTPEEKELLDDLGVEKVEPGGGEIKLTVLAREMKADIPARFKLRDGNWRNGAYAMDEAGLALASFSRGAGRVTLVAHAKPFRNRYIGMGDHARLLWMIVGQNEAGSVWFFQASSISFSGMLWERGWMAISVLLALLTLWLWRNMPRFGPLRVADDTGRRQFTEHIELTGAFLWRHREGRALLEPIQRQVAAAASRRGLDAHAPGGFDKIAEWAGLSAERVRAALTAVLPGDAHTFQRTIHDLETLREKL